MSGQLCGSSSGRTHVPTFPPIVPNFRWNTHKVLLAVYADAFAGEEMENSTSVYGDDPEDDELFAWEELMRFRSRTLESLSTDLDGCSISAQASISPDHEDIASANGAFMDSATDSGQTSDNDSRVFNPFASTGPNLRKRLIEGLLRDIYGTNRSYSEDLEETRNLVRRGSDSSQTAPGRKFSFADYTAWRAQYYKDLSTTLQRLGYQGTDRLDVTTLQQMGKVYS